MTSSAVARAPRLPSKVEVRAALRECLESDVAQATRSHKETQQGATHEEAKPENDKDTRALESSYLARGQARRVAELGEALARVEAMELRHFGDGAPAAVSALVQLDDGERATHYFLAPAGGGVTLSVGGLNVKVLTPSSPLGRALLGQRAGDDFEVKTPQGPREYSVVAVE